MRLKSLLFAASFGAAACTVQAPPQVMANPYPPVPPTPAEVIPKPPPTEEFLVRRPGEWEWVGNGYVWQPGEYVKKDGHSNEYLPGHWNLVNGAWVWEQGHWL
jgi:hypothetical protein